MNRKKNRGSAILEFCLTGILLLFVWISVEEMARGMWTYHTLQYAAKIAASYASVHGADCSAGSNSCTVSIGGIASVFQSAGIGLIPSQVAMTFTTDSGAVTHCNLGGSTNPCSSQVSTWPPASNNDNQVGKIVWVRADYTFNSALYMFAPGNGKVAFGAFDFPGDSKQVILF